MSDLEGNGAQGGDGTRKYDSKFLTPPAWKIKQMKYSDFKFETELWSKFTLMDKKQQGFAIYSTLPHEEGVADKIRLALQSGEIDLEDEQAVNKIFQVLDKWYGKDDLSATFEAWKAFKNFQRNNDQNIEIFMSNYDRTVKELQKHGVKLPEVILGMQLLDSANLDIKEKQIVLTAVDYNEKGEIYDQMKRAIKKFIGNANIENDKMIKIKEEIFMTGDEMEEKEAFIASRNNYRGRRPYRGSVENNYRGGYSESNFRGGYKSGYRSTEGRGSDTRGRGLGRGNFGRRRGGDLGPQKNPRDEYGNHMKCIICQSNMHFKKDCPHRRQEIYHCEIDDETPVKEVYKLDYTQDENCFMSETTHAAVLDSACSKTVAGRAWKDMYLSSLNNKENIKIYPSKNTYYKFGSGEKVVAKEIMEIPCIIGGINRTIRTDIVESDIPLLLSKPDMKKMGFKINLENDTLEVNGKSIDLDTTAGGHYFIPLQECQVKIENINLITELSTFKEKEKVINKLHRQFCHPSEKSLKDILINAEAYDQDCGKILENIKNTCEVCKRYKKTPPKPAVALPLAKQFNEVVAIDLKTFKDVYFIHFSDLHTRFHKAKVIRRKSPKIIIDSIATEWIGSGFGPPLKFLVDNGGEFDNAEYREMAEQFNVEVCSTAAYSPWSNGICERNHYIVDSCVQKMLEEDPNMQLEVALAWAVNAKNSMQNHLGFSPIQLVVGCNPNLPSAITNNLPAQEEVKVSDTLRRHLNALHSARRAFTKAESSERLKRALRHNVRVNEESFFQNDKVFYKRDDSNRWRGPGKVVGQDGKVLFIRHGSQLVRVATCRALKVENSKEKQKEMNEKSDQRSDEQNDQRKEKPTENRTVIDDNSDDEEIKTKDIHRQQQQQNNKTIHESNDNLEIDDINRPEIIAKQGAHNMNDTQEKETRKPKIQEKIKYKTENEKDWIIAKVIGKGGKATGKNKNYINVINEKDEKMIGIHLDKVQYKIINEDEDNECQENTQNQNIEEINVTYVPLGEHWRPEVIEAKEKELNNWKKFDVFNEIQDKGQTTISSRWVITQKEEDNEKFIKARLVVKGFQEQESIQSDSPTAAKSTLRLVIALAANENWKLQTIDIKAAFLQGKSLKREIYVIPPKEARKDGIIWQLNKVAYGLGDASRNWYMSVKDELLKLGMKQSNLDNALFRWYNQGKLEGIFIMHVDDFLFSGTTNFEENVIDKISKKYKVGKRQADNFKYVGITVSKTEKGIIIDQDHYAENLEEIHIPMHRKGDKQSPLTKEEQECMLSVAGQLNWLATQTRPDLSFETLELNMAKKKPKIENLKKANKAIKKAKTKSHILYSRLGSQEDLQITVYSDAAWGNLPDGTSSGQGHIIFLSYNENCCPISWTSNKIKRKVSSSLSAETLALHDALDEGLYLQAILTETLCDNNEQKIKITAKTDNKSLVDNLISTKQVSEKRLRINIAEIKRMQEQQEIEEIKWIQSKYQLADILTKSGVDPQPLLETIKNGRFYHKD